jgi:hypothetical protein
VNYDHRPLCVLVTGKKGSGKTTYWLSRATAHKARWKFYFDPRREVSRKLGLPTCNDVPKMDIAVSQCRPVCFDSSELFPGDRREGFAFFARYVMGVCSTLKGVKMIACDEFQSVQRTGDSGLPPGFKEITDEGRREEIDVLLAAQRLREVNDAVRGSLTEIVTFKHTDPLALEWIEEAAIGMGCEFDRAEVGALPTPGNWIRFCDDGTRTSNRKPKPQGTRDRETTGRR